MIEEAAKEASATTEAKEIIADNREAVDVIVKDKLAEMLAKLKPAHERNAANKKAKARKLGRIARKSKQKNRKK